MATNEDNHYVDNKRLYAEMVLYTQKYNEAIAAGLEPPRANDYIGKCIWLIANRL
jgi:hypothetical protein